MAKKLTYQTVKAQKFDFNTFPFVAVGFFLLVFLFTYKKIADYIRRFLSPDEYDEQVAKPVSSQNISYTSVKRIDSKGRFILGNGLISTHTVTEATAQAEELSAILGTEKSANWYTKVLAYGWTANVSRLKAILNPNYPANYRRYVIEAYRDIYTDKKSLSADSRAMFDGIVFGSGVPVTVTKYFIL